MIERHLAAGLLADSLDRREADGGQRLRRQDGQGRGQGGQPERLGKPARPWADETANRIGGDEETGRNQQSHHQVRWHEVPRGGRPGGMHRQHGLRELRQMADSQAEHRQQEDQQQPVLPVPGPAREQPNQQEVQADFKRRQQLAVESAQAHDVAKIPGQAVTAFFQGPGLPRPDLLHGSADRDTAAEHEQVVRGIRQNARYGPEQRNAGLPPGRRAERRPARIGAGLRPLRPGPEAERRRGGQGDRRVLQPGPRQGERDSGQSPLPPPGIPPEAAQSDEQEPQREERGGGFHAAHQRSMPGQERERGEQQDPRQARQPPGQDDQADRAGDQRELEGLDPVERRLRIENPVEGRDEEQPERVVAVRLRDPAIEGRELPCGQVPRNLAVVEGVIEVEVEQVHQVQVAEELAEIHRAAAQESAEEKDQRPFPRQLPAGNPRPRG